MQVMTVQQSEALRIGKHLRYTRRVKDLTQEELAENLEISVGWVSSIERGTKLPNLKLLFRIAQALHGTCCLGEREQENKTYRSSAITYVTHLTQLRSWADSACGSMVLSFLIIRCFSLVERKTTNERRSWVPLCRRRKVCTGVNCVRWDSKVYHARYCRI